MSARMTPYDDPYDLVSTGSQSDPEERVIRIGRKDGRPCDLDAWQLRGAILDACDEAGYEREGGPVRIVIEGDVRLHGDARRLLAPRGGFNENGPSYTFDDSLKKLNTTGVTNMAQMFVNCDKADQIDVSGFDTSNVTDMSEMFSGCESLKSLDVTGFDTSNVVDMSEMFADCKSLESLDVTGFDDSNLRVALSMFKGCESLETVDISGFNTIGEFYDMMGDRAYTMLSGYTGNAKKKYIGEDMGYDNPDDVVSTETTDAGERVVRIGYPDGTPCDLDAQGLREALEDPYDESETVDYDDRPRTHIVLSGPVRLHGNATGLFGSLYASYTFDESLRQLDTSDVTRMKRMFDGCVDATNIDVSAFDTSNVTDITAMFKGCKSLKSLDMSNLDLSKITGATAAFFNCKSLERLDLSGTNASSVRDASHMLSGCSNLTWVGLSRFGAHDMESAHYMMSGCTSLETIHGLSPKLSEAFKKDPIRSTDWWRSCHNLHHITGMRMSTDDGQVIEADISLIPHKSRLPQQPDRYDTSDLIRIAKAERTHPTDPHPAPMVKVTWKDGSTTMDTDTVNRMRDEAARLEGNDKAREGHGPSTAMRDALSTIRANAGTYAPEPDPVTPAPDMPAPETPVTRKNGGPRHHDGDFGN